MQETNREYEKEEAMTPEEKCVDLEHAKPLVEAGIILETDYYFCRLNNKNNYTLEYKDYLVGEVVKELFADIVPAPDSGELLEWLREKLKYPIIQITHYGESWDCFNRSPEISFRNINLPNALAELAVWVVKKGL